LSMMLTLGLSCIAFTMLRYIPSISSFHQSFYHEMVMNFIKAFSAFTEMSKCFLFLLL
jgi:hypothetical protein